jgi:hypothetical protein
MNKNFINTQTHYRNTSAKLKQERYCQTVSTKQNTTTNQYKSSQEIQPTTQQSLNQKTRTPPKTGKTTCCRNYIRFWLMQGRLLHILLRFSFYFLLFAVYWTIGEVGF